MFVFPGGPVSDLVRNNIQSQFSVFMNTSQNFVKATMQLGELNAQAGRKLMEESATALTKGMQIRTLADIQSFMAEQSQVTMDRIRGYALNVQNIAAQNWVDPGTPAVVMPVTQTSAQIESAVKDSARETAASPRQHEADPHPSPLVEKLVASVVNEQNKLH